ncbi:MAG: hypothetical protein R2799_10525 [Crocinitomicaceae bacterium]
MNKLIFLSLISLLFFSCQKEKIVNCAIYHEQFNPAVELKSIIDYETINDPTTGSNLQRPIPIEGSDSTYIDLNGDSENDFKISFYHFTMNTGYGPHPGFIVYRFIKVECLHGNSFVSKGTDSPAKLYAESDKIVRFFGEWWNSKVEYINIGTNTDVYLGLAIGMNAGWLKVRRDSNDTLFVLEQGFSQTCSGSIIAGQVQ